MENSSSEDSEGSAYDEISSSELSTSPDFDEYLTFGESHRPKTWPKTIRSQFLSFFH